MEWFSQNWVWLLFAIGMVAMHMFGHGGHGGHGGHSRHDSGDDTAEAPRKVGAQRSSEHESGHHH